jgi:hypothetical protein
LTFCCLSPGKVERVGQSRPVAAGAAGETPDGRPVAHGEPGYTGRMSALDRSETGFARTTRRAGTLFHRFAERTERFPGFDRLADGLAEGADRGMRRAGVKEMLSGSWLGHPLHPLATDAVIGSWTMAVLLESSTSPPTRPIACSELGSSRQSRPPPPAYRTGPT